MTSLLSIYLFFSKSTKSQHNYFTIKLTGCANNSPSFQSLIGFLIITYSAFVSPTITIEVEYDRDDRDTIHEVEDAIDDYEGDDEDEDADSEEEDDNSQ